VIVTRLHPGVREEFDLGSPEGLERVAELYRAPRREWLRINLVASINGNASGNDGTSDGLSNRVDRKILGIIRRASDVVLVGAAGVRAEGYLLPRTAPLAVLSASGDLTGHAIPPGTPDGRVLVFCTRDGLDRARATLRGASAEVVVLPDERGRIAPDDLVAALRDRGLLHIVCEGGPSLAGQLLDAGVVDELCLTTSPRIMATSLPVFGAAISVEQEVGLSGLLLDEGSALYARWSLRR
jgi:riboflavin biosynthesis pyrimidine reductase